MPDRGRIGSRGFVGVSIHFTNGSTIVNANPVPTFRAAHLSPYLEHFHDREIAIDGALREFRLPVMLCAQPEARLPLLPALEFLSHIQRSQSINDLGMQAGGHVDLSLLSILTRQEILSSATLGAAINTLIVNARLECSALQVWTTEEGDETRICNRLRLSGDDEEQRVLQIHFVLLFCAIVRVFAPPGWTPVTIGFRSSEPSSLFAGDQFPNTRFLVDQTQTWVSVPSNILSLQRRFVAATARPVISKLALTNSDDFVTSLKSVLRTYLADGYPNIDLAADICRMSVRTLQRNLANLNVTYSGLVEHARLEAAKDLLRHSDTKIIDVAFALGYDDPSHFSRAFRRLAGISPRAYRGSGSRTPKYVPPPLHQCSAA